VQLEEFLWTLCLYCIPILYSFCNDILKEAVGVYNGTFPLVDSMRFDAFNYYLEMFRDTEMYLNYVAIVSIATEPS